MLLMMDDKFNRNNQQRKIIQAVRPADKSKIKHKQNKDQNNIYINDSKSFKRKYNDVCRNESKKFKEETAALHKYQQSSRTPINIASKRLQKLRKSLEENKKEAEIYNSPVSSIKELVATNSRLTYETNSIGNLKNPFSNSRKPIQDKLKRDVNLTKLNESSYKKYGLTKNINQSKIKQRNVSSKSVLNKTLPPYVNKRKPEASFSPLNKSTPIKYETMSNPRSVIVNTSENIFPNIETFEKSTDFYEKNLSYSSTINSSDNTQISDFIEDMDWSPVNEEIVINNIGEIRKEIDYNDQVVSINIEPETPKKVSNGLYVVVDTNIFLSHLNFISEFKKMTFRGKAPTIIVVPWMVIQELDFMKDGRSQKSLKGSSKKAVDYINNCLMKKDPHLKGQNVMDASKQDIQSNNPDDGILFCCLQLLQQGKEVVLLSNDKNFRNKAMFNNIQAYSKDDIIKNLNKIDIDKTAKIEELSYDVDKIKLIVCSCLSKIIEAEMSNAYGDLWMKMAKVVPPFTLDEAIRCFEKYWVAVFSFKLLKQAKQCIDEFKEFLKSINHRNSLSKENFTKFVAFCLRLCIYLKNGYSEHSKTVFETIDFIQKCTTLYP